MVNKLIILLAYAVLGFYFVNYPFNFVEIPELITIYNQWIIFAGGVLLFIAIFSFLKAPHMPK